jgi:hypothetical protein
MKPLIFRKIAEPEYAFFRFNGGRMGAPVRAAMDACEFSPNGGFETHVNGGSGLISQSQKAYPFRWPATRGGQNRVVDLDDPDFDRS